MFSVEQKRRKLLYAKGWRERNTERQERVTSDVLGGNFERGDTVAILVSQYNKLERIETIFSRAIYNGGQRVTSIVLTNPLKVVPSYLIVEGISLVHKK